MNATLRVSNHCELLTAYATWAAQEKGGQVLAENASKQVKRYRDNFARTLEEWNKPPPSGGKKCRRPDRIDPAIFKAVVEPLIEEVLETADRQESRHTHGSYFVRGEDEAFCDGDGLFRCMCGGEDVGCQQGFSSNPFDILTELVLIEAYHIDHRVSQNGLARYVYNTATTVYNSRG
ncbi:hypothetical protein RvY_08276 [Ramazzottius varieornatus]|uniref:DNA fragmentation factor 40 C-terminal domain-containing protein n=1 Tax=Ramazzottius varieornatus TaxID=947166 RepID=A0A1D1V801_RAMVA|nr:hypothetical protein RvY_08276 [Ramazzottius varieornatus]